MAQSGTEQHEGRVAVQEAAHPTTGAATNLPVESLGDIIGTDTSPVFTGKIAVAQPDTEEINGHFSAA